MESVAEITWEQCSGGPLGYDKEEQPEVRGAKMIHHQKKHDRSSYVHLVTCEKTSEEPLLILGHLR